MRKGLALAILGTALTASVGARAETGPAFIGATACEAAAPLRTDALAMHRAVSTRAGEAVRARGTDRAANARAGERTREQRHAAPLARRPAEARAAEARAERRTDEAPAEAPAEVDEAPALRRAVHFCVGTPGARRVWRT